MAAVGGRGGPARPPIICLHYYQFSSGWEGVFCRVRRGEQSSINPRRPEPGHWSRGRWPTVLPPPPFVLPPAPTPSPCPDLTPVLFSWRRPRDVLIWGSEGRFVRYRWLPSVLVSRLWGLRGTARDGAGRGHGEGKGRGQNGAWCVAERTSGEERSYERPAGRGDGGSATLSESRPGRGCVTTAWCMEVCEGSHGEGLIVALLDVAPKPLPFRS